MPRDRAKKREQAIESGLERAARDLDAAIKVYRRAPETTRLSMYTQMMLRSARENLEWLERACRHQKGTSEG